MVIHKKDLMEIIRIEQAGVTIGGHLLKDMQAFIREQYNYGKNDKIVMLIPVEPKAPFHFVVAREDGSIDKIEYHFATKRVEGGWTIGASKLVRERYIKSDEDTTYPKESEFK
jgi:hypothetical protein